MLRGPLHDRGADGRCTECGERFPCPTGLAIFEAVKRELEHPTPPPRPVASPPRPPSERPTTVRWEDLDDREHRCPRCLHGWVSHGVPGEADYGCSMIESSATERWEMAERDRELQRQGVPPEVAGPQAYRDLHYCGCTFADGNRVTPRQVRIWQDGTSWPLAPEDRADCGHYRRGPIRADDSQECLDCGVVFVSDG